MNQPDWRQPQHVETLAAFDTAETATPPRSVPELHPCRAVGPYVSTRVGKHKTEYLQVRCTRPAGHPGNHQHATAKSGPTHEWTTAGAKVWPKR
jgi:hypothetical protein